MSYALPRTSTGTMLATARVAMAVLFGVWVSLDPVQPALATPGVVAGYAGYLLASLVLLAVARTSWWYEHLLARPAFALDALVFLAGLYATEAVTLDLFSVFITFFAFLILSSAMRWDERTTEAVAGLLVTCFLLAGLLVSTRGLPVDLPKFVRRLIYLLLLAFLLTRFARERSVRAAPRFASPRRSEAGDPVEQALDYAMAAYGASNGIIAWLEEGALQPRVLSRPGPCDGLPALDAQPGAALFDRDRRRCLSLRNDRRVIARSGAAVDALAARLPGSESLAIPVECRAGKGQLVLAGIAGLSRDDLVAAPAIAAEIERAIDDEATGALAREVAMARLRTALAADLHDGVAQTLAGVQFRLKALAAKVSTGTATEAEVTSIANGIASEQQHVRLMIDRLRRDTISPGQRDLREELLVLAGGLAEQWQVTIDLAERGEVLLLPASRVYQVQQIVREAVANAVRHGQASRITIVLGSGPRGGPMLEIVDNGCGCAPGHVPEPRSLAERAAALGARMAFEPCPGATRVRVELPGGSA